MTFVSNLNEPIVAGLATVGLVGFQDVHLSNAFTTGPNVGGYTLDSVTIRWQRAAGSPEVFLDPQVSIYSNSQNNRPQTQLELLPGPSPAAAVLPESLDYLSGGLHLAPNTTYHLHLDGNPIASAPIAGYLPTTPDSGQETSPDLWTISDNALQFADGEFSMAFNTPLAFAVQATAVPEPRTFLLWTSPAILGFVITRRLRFRRMASI